MDEELDRLVIAVRADTGAFARDVATMRSDLAGLGDGSDKAGRAIENALVRASRTGKLGFDDLGKVALTVLDEIAASAIRSGIGAILGGGGSGGGGLLSAATSLIGGLLGLPGRATGGPVSPGRAYMVGERGPELFVPTNAGQVQPVSASQGPRDVRVAISINAAAGTEPQALTRSGRQVARAVRSALQSAGG